MREISLFRLYLLRALYLFVVVGLAIDVWPDIIHHENWGIYEGIVKCMLIAFSLMCILGLRYPLQMLPVFLWELVWKTLWLMTVALPQWWGGHIDESLKPSIFAISFVWLFYVAIPWRYVLNHYAKKPGDRWGLPIGRPVGENDL
jgi:hypothetical protein